MTNEYFAAANTKDGFYSLFDEIFSQRNLDKLYILKGGPGCGKSTCIKAVSQKAKEAGFNPVEYHCSSDPHSLDAVVIPEIRVAVIDGTLPHAKEPSAAGITEIIVDLGVSWDTAGLYLQKDKLLPLIKEKTENYSMAYRFLSALGKMHECMDSITKNALLCDKLKVSAQRLLLKIDTKKDCPQKDGAVFTKAISGKGEVRYFTFENISQSIYFIKDDYLSAKYFLKELEQTAISKKMAFLKSQSPLCPSVCDGLYFFDACCCFTLYDEKFARQLDAKGTPYKVINMKRFLDKEKLSLKLQTFRFCKKCAAELKKAAVLNLKQASQIHAKLESIYSLYTDYDKVSNITENLVKEIFTQ